MKKMMFIILMCFGMSAHAGWIANTITNAAHGGNTVKNTAKYKVEATGFDLRVVEWIPKDNPAVRCVFVAGHTNSSGVACYKIDLKH